MHNYQITFNIALILEQMSNYNNVLREQVSMEKSAHEIQNDMISNNNIIRTRTRATSKEHVPNGLDDENVKNESKHMKEDKWVNIKKYTPINYFYITCEDKAE